MSSYDAKMFQQSIDNPYFELESTSNGHKHRRYIMFGEVLDEPRSGSFEQSGLSKTGQFLGSGIENLTFIFNAL